MGLTERPHLWFYNATCYLMSGTIDITEWYHRHYFVGILFISGRRSSRKNSLALQRIKAWNGKFSSVLSDKLPLKAVWRWSSHLKINNLESSPTTDCLSTGNFNCTQSLEHNKTNCWDPSSPLLLQKVWMLIGLSSPLGNAQEEW